MVDKIFPTDLTDAAWASGIKLLGDTGSGPVNIPITLLTRDSTNLTALSGKSDNGHVHQASDVTSGAFTKARLAASGTAGQVLTLDSGGTTPTWADPASLSTFTPGNDKILASDADGDIVAYSGIRTIPLGIKGAPTSGDVWYSAPMPWVGIILGARATIIGSSTPGITGTVKVGATAVTGLTAVALAVANAATRVDATAANTFAAGDILSFTHTSAPGGTVTDAIVSLEVVQR